MFFPRKEKKGGIKLKDILIKDDPATLEIRRSASINMLPILTYKLGSTTKQK